MNNEFYSAYNGQSMDRMNIPILPVLQFRESVCAMVNKGMRLSALLCFPSENKNTLFAVLADAEKGKLRVGSCHVGKKYPALTPDCMQAHLFEREIYENYGILPEGHPWLKPVRFPHNSFSHNSIGDMDYFKVQGDEIHEVAVGPIHAGVIEPGHFRFQCHGEVVYNLEISLGYQHRGIEKVFTESPASRQIHYIETASGDSTAAHTIAYSNVMESLCETSITARSQALRGIALELERIACHIGDLGALSGDVGFMPASAYCGRIRGNVLNMTAVLCGNRFSRNLIRPGGVRFDLDADQIDHLLKELKSVRKDAANAIELMFNTPSVLARFEHTGAVPPEDAVKIGMVGPAARAAGIDQDVRTYFPAGIYKYQHIPTVSASGGDVMARAMVRWLEVQRSFTFVEEMLQSLPQSEILSDLGAVQADKFVLALTEGWRGEICHLAQTDRKGNIINYKIIDPSFHNWLGLALALRNEQISDFPVCNKSFNLSYCAVDL